MRNIWIKYYKNLISVVQAVHKHHYANRDDVDCQGRDFR